MSPFFGSPSRKVLLAECASRWVGTPFAVAQSVRGAGVDCVRFAAEVYRECGVFPEYQFPRYTIDGGDHLHRSQIEEWITSRGDQFAKVSGEPEPGDLLLFQIGKGVAHHVGVYAGGLGRRVWSSMSHDGVRERTLRDPVWGRRLQVAFRPMEVAS